MAAVKAMGFNMLRMHIKAFDPAYLDSCDLQDEDPTRPIIENDWIEPEPTAIEPLATAWGSTVFRFTTDHGALPCLPRRALVTEDSTIQAVHAVVRVEEGPFPDTPVVIAFKPMPDALTGTVVGSHTVGPGRMVFCQYRLSDRAASGDAVARSVLSDVLRWAAEPRPVLNKDSNTGADGRRVVAHSWSDQVAR